MIRPISPAHLLADPDFCEDFLAPEGPLSRAFEARFPNRSYEPRVGQGRMTRAVAAAFDSGHHLGVEAGTGTGKTFAYLVPAFRAAAAGRKVVISTHTLALQDQLLLQDLPLLQEAWRAEGLPEVPAVLLKGRRNYLCKRRLRNALTYQADLFDREASDALAPLAEWAADHPDATLQDIPFAVPPAVWDEVCAEDDLCRYPGHRGCRDCVFPRRWAEAESAGLVIVNHALFFSDLSLRMQGGGLLPDYDLVVFDEAHELEQVAGSHMGFRLTEYTVRRWLRRLSKARGQRGLFRVASPEAGMRAVEQTSRSLGLWFESVGTWMQRGATGDEVGRPNRELDDAFPRDTPLAGQLRTLSRAMLELAENDQVPGGLRGDWVVAARRGQALADGIDDLLHGEAAGHVQWVEGEVSGGGMRWAIQSVPVQVGPVLAAGLYDTLHSAVHCSATLSWRGHMDYFFRRVGLEDAEELLVPSPFNWEEQLAFYVDDRMPDPTASDYLDALTRRIPEAVAMTGGGALVLFTNARHLEEVLRGCRAGLERAGYTVFAQGEQPSREQLVRAFAASDRGVLFGLATFWTGMDVPGKALRNVIITRLPFAVPDHPLTRARMAGVEQSGGSSFMEFSLPEAALRFRQGVGRLIRSTTDEGQVVVLDNRVVTKRYGSFFRVPGVSVRRLSE